MNLGVFFLLWRSDHHPNRKSCCGYRIQERNLETHSAVCVPKGPALPTGDWRTQQQQEHCTALHCTGCTAASIYCT